MHKKNDGDGDGHGHGHGDGSMGEHDESKVTIVVHSDIVGVVQSITKKFEEYKKHMNPKYKCLVSNPVVTMRNLTSAEVAAKKTKDGGSPEKPKEVTKIPITSSECAEDQKPVKVYIDEDLLFEEQIITCHLQPVATKGKEMSEYQIP